MKKNKTMIFLFILPTVLCLLFMYVYPVVRTVIMSFFKVESLTATTSTWSFYGLQNYFKILRNAGFISSMKNMVMIWLVGGIITMCLSMLMRIFIKDGRNVPAECQQCRWVNLCHGGCKRDRNTADKAQRSYYCKALQKFFAYAEPRMREMARAVQMYR